MVASLFSLNVLAAGDMLGCDNTHTWERYHKLHEWMKNNASNIDSKIYMVYNLAIVSLCLGKESEGIDHLQKASNSGHTPATFVLGVYHEKNQTFDSSESTKNIENLNNAIHYYDKGAQMIEATSNYPEGSTDDMPYIESESYTSFRLFAGLPSLYFRGYTIAIKNIVNGNNEEETFYNDTLEVLNKMKETALICLERPALSVWKEKQETVYKAQQIKCSAYLTFAEAAYPLEEQRIEADKNCTVPLKECTEHKEVLNKIRQPVGDMLHQMDSVPKI